MVQNYDLKTAQKKLSTIAAVDIVGNAVPVGMKRYITFVKMCNIHASAAQTVTLYDGETGTGIDTPLDVQKLALGDTIMYPDNPDPEKPIMCVEGGNYLTGSAGVDADAFEVTVGFYDE